MPRMAEPTPRLWRLLVQCPDRPGIVAAVSSYLARQGANIVHADQHSTAGEPGGAEPRFFMRIELDAAGVGAPAADLKGGFAEEVAVPFAMEWQLADAAARQRVAVLVSRADHCLLELLWRWRRGELPIEIPLVISNHEVLRDQVESFGIPFHYLPVTPETKPEQERAMLTALTDGVDLVVLARYMQVLSGDFIARYPSRVMNIHHSFLPAFAGADPYRQAFERGVKIIGATAHYATEELDEGPIVEQDVARVTHRASRDQLVRLGREVERSVLARAVQWHVEDRVFVHGRKTIVFR
jgi:formyltetrahydrofolate deformylase